MLFDEGDGPRQSRLASRLPRYSSLSQAQ
jgi:hypothetical protein